MANERRSFYPLYTRSNQTTGVNVQGGLQASVTVAGTAAAVASTVFPGTKQNQYCQIQIANQSAQWAFVNFGSLVMGAVTAATVAASYPVAPNSTVVVSVDPEVDGASVILASGTGNVTFTRGEGI